MSDIRNKRSRKVSLAEGDDPRDRSSVGDSLTEDMLGPGLELVKGKIQLKISPDSPHYTDEMGYFNTRAGPGLTVAPGSPMSLQAVPADPSVQVTAKGLRARPHASQVAGLQQALAERIAAGVPAPGNAVVQATSKTTGVTVTARGGQITMDAALLGAGAAAVFTVTCAEVRASDVPTVAIRGGGTSGSYSVDVSSVADGSFDVAVRNVGVVGLAEPLVLNYLIGKVEPS